jgi:hypothetical protein
MAKDWTKKVILLKAETTEGIDAGPTVGADALQVLNYQPTFMDADKKVRAIEKAYFGADPVALTSFKRGCTFDMEMGGSGTKAGVPPWMLATRFCGFGVPVTNSSTGVSQSPTSSVPSATHWAFLDNLLLQSLGMRGSVGFKVADDDYPTLSFNLLGVPPQTLAQETAPGTPTITGYNAPVLSSSQNSAFMLAGYAAPLRSWEMNSNSDVALRSLIGPADRINYANRAWRGNIIIELPDLASQNYFSAVRPGTTMPAQFTNGTMTGQVIGIAAPALQVSDNVTLSEEQGKVMCNLPVTALAVQGNDEIAFTSG